VQYKNSEKQGTGPQSYAFAIFSKSILVMIADVVF